MKKMMIILAVLVLAGCLPPDTKPAAINSPAFLEAEMLFLQGNYSQAITRLNTYIRSDARGRGYLLRGACHLYEGNYTQAVEDYRQGIARADVLDEYIQGHLGLADALYSMQAYDESRDIYAMLLSDFGDRIPRDVVMLRHSHGLIRSGEAESGKQMLDDIQMEFPDSAIATEAAGLAEEARGGFYIQAGRFSRYDNARSLETRLLGEGFEPLIIEQGSTYVVIIGYFESHAGAQRVLNRVKAAGVSGAFIKP